MIRKLILLLSAIVWPGLALAQFPPADVHVKLSLADNKATYRIGEPIKLVLDFTADADGYQVDTVADRSQQTSDFISVSPDSGVNHWLENLGGRQPRDVLSLAKLSTTPTRLDLLLNYSIRFDSPGRGSEWDKESTCRHLES